VDRTHVAILDRSAGAALVAGRKRVETRFSRRRRAPFGAVAPGETIHFKLSGGRWLGHAQVMFVQHFSELTPRMVDWLRRRIGAVVQAPRSYWQARRQCRFGVLIGLGPLHAGDGPTVPRQFGNGWVVMPAGVSANESGAAARRTRGNPRRGS
jgi:hypothetical protein